MSWSEKSECLEKVVGIGFCSGLNFSSTPIGRSINKYCVVIASASSCSQIAYIHISVASIPSFRSRSGVLDKIQNGSCNKADMPFKGHESSLFKIKTSIERVENTDIRVSDEKNVLYPSGLYVADVVKCLPAANGMA